MNSNLPAPLWDYIQTVLDELLTKNLDMQNRLRSDSGAMMSPDESDYSPEDQLFWNIQNSEKVIDRILFFRNPIHSLDLWVEQCSQTNPDVRLP